MIIRFDLPESPEEYDETEETLGEPCFPYPGFEERPEEVKLWSSKVTVSPVRLNLKDATSISHRFSGHRCRFGERKVWLHSYQ